MTDSLTRSITTNADHWLGTRKDRSIWVMNDFFSKNYGRPYISHGKLRESWPVILNKISVSTLLTAHSPCQHRTTSSTKESCHRQTGGESQCSWELATTKQYLQLTTTTPAIQKVFVAWVGTSWHQQSVERILEVGLSGQCPPRGQPHNPTAGFCSPSTTVVSSEPLPHRTRSLRCL